MRFLEAGVIGVLAAALTGPATGWALSRPETPSHGQPRASAIVLAGPTGSVRLPELSATLLIADDPDRKQTNAPSGQGERIGRSFDRFGHSVASGAKEVGHAVEGGAKKVGHSVVEGWESFKRNFTGR
jgi:hypothetical protein